MTVINTNVGALMARTYATKANSKMTTSMERLSSGLRINSAADDAAGLAVANKMVSQLNGTSMAVRNSQDGISLVQTAESGMNEVASLILRMRELAVQMDNGVYTGSDRDNAQLEINALLAEIDKIAANTRFNDVKLLDGTYDQTIRAGNTNSEKIKISIDSLFAKDNGLGATLLAAGLNHSQTSSSLPATYNLNSAQLFGQRLGINALSASDLAIDQNNSALTSIVSSKEIRASGENLLLLKDNVNGLGYMYAGVKLTDQQLEQVLFNLQQAKDLSSELNLLDASNSVRYRQINASLEALEKERSLYIGSLFHANQIKEGSMFVGDGSTNNNFAEILSVYSDPDTRQSLVGEMAAVEIEFSELAKTLHDPSTCEHCIAQSRAGGQLSGGTEGFNENGDAYAALVPDYQNTGSGYAAVSAPSSSSVSPLIKGAKWTSVGDDGSAAGGAANLSYSYYDTDDAPYNYVQGTRSTVESHGAGNATAHDEIFALWDNVSPFSLDKVDEDSAGNTVGDLRVAFTDTGPAGAAAFAYYPNGGASGGDIYYINSAVDTVSGVDFVEGNYNWLTGLHEVGHALGLSHPFDGGSKDGSTLNLNLDSQRNTVMTYVQRDRNYTLSYSGGSATVGQVHTSTPGLLDIEAIEYLYGSTNWNYNSGNDTAYGGGSGSNLFDNNYQSIRTIVDSGGTGDTIDASRVTATENIINLTPGTYSSINYYATQDDKINAVVTDGNQSIKNWFKSTLASLDALASASNSYYQTYTREALYRGQDNVGIAHNTWIENAKGGTGADTITGNSLGNEITGNGGNDTIDGGGGSDVAIYTDAKANYSISSSYDGTVTVSHTGGAANEGTDTLKNMEYIKFSDGYYDIATSTWNNGGTVPGLTGTQSGAQTGGATYGDGATNIGGLALNAIKVQTQSDSKNAVTILDQSLQQVASARAKLGAIMNRLQHNIDNQTNSGLNIRQARGRIVDSDLAIESTKLAQQMILSQAAQQAINMAAQRQLTVLALLET